MATVNLIPAAHQNNGAVYGTTDSFSALSTADVYTVRTIEDGKVGILLHFGVAASSEGVGRVKVQNAQSSDGTWGAGFVGTTGVETYFIGPTVTASSSEAIFLGPFESARFGTPSTVTTHQNVINLYFDCATANTIYESTRYMDSTDLYATPTIFAYRLP